MKQTHLLLLVGILLFLCYCNREKIEAFGNQLIVPQFEFAILTPNQDPMSGYFQEEICRDDPKWRKGDKKCVDYSMDRNSCSDTGENGKSAMDACPVSCDSCPSSVKIKRREPSPMEDVEEPDYSLFEEETGLLGATLDGVDYRDIYERLDEINERLDEGAMLDPGYIAYLSDKDNCETLPPKLEPLRVQLCDDVGSEDDNDVDEVCNNSRTADFKAGCVGGLEKWRSCHTACCREKWFPFEEVSRVDALLRDLGRGAMEREREDGDGAGEEGGAATEYKNSEIFNVWLKWASCKVPEPESEESDPGR